MAASDETVMLIRKLIEVFGSGQFGCAGCDPDHTRIKIGFILFFSWITALFREVASGFIWRKVRAIKVDAANLSAGF